MGLRILLLVLGMLLLGYLYGQQTFTAAEIVKKAEERMRGKTLEAEMTITTHRAKWTREMDIKSWSKGNDFALILIRAPIKDKGIVYLKRERALWNWIPTLERNIRLPPSMMSHPWMGTDFTHDDLVKESSLVSDYIPTLLGTEDRGGRSCYKIELMPKPGAAVVWGKLVVWIDTSAFVEMCAAFYDEEDKLVQTLTGSDLKILGGRLMPSQLEMVPADRPNQRTIIRYKSIVFDRPIDEGFFSIENMHRISQ